MRDVCNGTGYVWGGAEMTPCRFWLCWGLLGCVLAAVVWLAGCGTESQYSDATAPVTPAALVTPFQTPCAPPVTAAPGQIADGYSYRVWSNDCTRTEWTTIYTVSEPAGLSMPTPAAECTALIQITPRPCN